jgi:hypothetical protein
MITRKKINRKVLDKTHPQNFRIFVFLLVHEIDKQWPFSTIQSCVMLKYRKSYCIRIKITILSLFLAKSFTAIAPLTKRISLPFTGWGIVVAIGQGSGHELNNFIDTKTKRRHLK